MNNIQKSYEYCIKFTRKHNELFPVASWFLPKALRAPIAVIYTFARQADDIADEGNFSADERLRQLNDYEEKTNTLLYQRRQDPSEMQEDVFLALADVFQKHPQLPVSLLLDLLSAFKQDVLKSRYNNYREVLEYAKRSANPIGRLLLHLHHQDTPQYLEASDAMCTTLQLINILNDIENDWHTRKRCYLPLDEMHTFGLSVADLENQNPITAPFQSFIHQQLNHIDALFAQSHALWHLPGRFGWEIRLIMQCAKRMIQKLKFRKNLNQGLTLNYFDWFTVVAKKQKPW